MRSSNSAHPLAPDVELKVTDILVVGLGNSFASGEGNPNSPIRLAGDYYNNYEAYLTTHQGDGRDWCYSLSKGNSSVAKIDCGSPGKPYLLGGYPTRAGTKSNYEDNDFKTKRNYFDTPLFNTKNSNWLSTACHRSLYSYQTRVALQLALEDEHRAVTFLGYACSAELKFWTACFSPRSSGSRKSTMGTNALGFLSSVRCREICAGDTTTRSKRS